MSTEQTQQEQVNKNDQNEPPFDRYTIEKTLGEGNFGKVKKGIHKVTGEQVAIKILQKDLIFEQTDIQRISKEIKIMKKVRHPNIIQLYQIIETTKRLYLIMQFADRGDLFDQIVSKDQLSEQSAQQYFAQLIIGLQYLHNLGITHRDLKPQNLLISGQLNQIKIADFGLGSFFTPGQLLKTACGSPCYAPPQMLNKLSYDPKKVDLWSSGILLHAMVLGYLPFQDEVTSKLYEKIKYSNFQLPFRISNPCKDLIRKLLKKDPAQRITLAEVKQHEWLKSSIQQYIGVKFDIVSQEFQQICERYGIVEKDRLLKNLKENKHNNLTTLYYMAEKIVHREQIQNKKTRNGSALKQDITFKNLIEQKQSDECTEDAQKQKKLDFAQKSGINQNEQGEQIQQLPRKRVNSDFTKKRDQEQAYQVLNSDKINENLNRQIQKQLSKASSSNKVRKGREESVQYLQKEKQRLEEDQIGNEVPIRKDSDDLQQHKQKFQFNNLKQIQDHLQFEYHNQIEIDTIRSQEQIQLSKSKSNDKNIQSPIESQKQSIQKLRQNIEDKQQDKQLQPPQKIGQTSPKVNDRQNALKIPVMKINKQPRRIIQSPPKDTQLKQGKANQVIKMPVLQKNYIKKENKIAVKQQLNKTMPASAPTNKFGRKTGFAKVQKTKPIQMINEIETKKQQQSQLKQSENLKEKRKLVKNPRMPIHKTHNINRNLNENKQAPPLVQHSQSKQRPLMLRKINAKCTFNEPHLIDPRKIVLCSIDQFIKTLQSKGFGGRLQYYAFGNDKVTISKTNKLSNAWIYLIKNGLTGKRLSLVIRQINEKFK